MAEIYELKVGYKSISEVKVALLKIGRSQKRFENFSSLLGNSEVLIEGCEDSEIISLLCSIPVIKFDDIQFENIYSARAEGKSDEDHGLQESVESTDRVDDAFGNSTDLDSNDIYIDIRNAAFESADYRMNIDWSYPDVGIKGVDWFWFGGLDGVSFIAEEVSQWFSQDNPVDVLHTYLEENYLRLAEDDIWGTLAKKIRLFVYSSLRLSSDPALSAIADYQLHQDDLVCLVDKKFLGLSEGHEFTKSHMTDLELALILDQILRVFDDDHSNFSELVLDKRECLNEDPDPFIGQKKLIEFVTELASGNHLSECHWPQIANIYTVLISFKSFDEGFGGPFDWRSIAENDYPDFARGFLESVSAFFYFWEEFFFRNLSEASVGKLPLAAVPAVGLSSYNSFMFQDDSLVEQRFSDVELGYAVAISILCPNREVSEASFLESCLVLSRAGYGVSISSLLSLFLICKAYPNIKSFDNFKYGISGADRHSPEILRFINGVAYQTGARARLQLSHAVSIFINLDQAYARQAYAIYDYILPKIPAQQDIFSLLMKSEDSQILPGFDCRIIKLKEYWLGETEESKLSFVLACSSLVEDVLYAVAKPFASQLHVGDLDQRDSSKILDIVQNKSSMGNLWNFVRKGVRSPGLRNKDVLERMKEFRSQSKFLDSSEIFHSMAILTNLRNRVAHKGKADAEDAAAFYYLLRNESFLKRLMELPVNPT